MKRLLTSALYSLLLASIAHSQAHRLGGRPLLVISVDGLDYRYLRDCDKLGLKIPNLRRLMREGEVTEGIVGVFPTVTWPSHTTLITGVDPRAHGILGNRRPREEGGDYYWDVSLLKTKTLWHAAREAGLKTAAITWPVTVGAAIDFNLPEYFQKRRGGAMDLPSIEKKSTPGLVEKIAKAFPSFAQEWMDDRTRTLATVYLLKYEKPDLLLLHLVDLDAEAHENGPFTREANAVLEYTDELIGQMLRAAPPETAVAVVSDHGFERADRFVDVNQLMARDGVIGKADMRLGLLTANDEAAVNWLRAASREGKHGVGREIPSAELLQFTPNLANVAVAFEPAAHHLFGLAADGQSESKPAEAGVHGLWPARADYRASFVLWGKGIEAARKPEAPMGAIAPRLAELLGVKMPGERR